MQQTIYDNKINSSKPYMTIKVTEYVFRPAKNL